MFSWFAHFIERHPYLHRLSLALWRLFPPRLAGFLKGLLTRNWMVGAVAVMVDESTTPPEVLLVQHSYRTIGAWGLPGGALESISTDQSSPKRDESGNNVIESALQREIFEELKLEIDVLRLVLVDAIPYVAEEPGPYRLDFYYLCAPKGGFSLLRQDLNSGRIKPRSPEVEKVIFVPVTDLSKYDLFSSDIRFFRKELPSITQDKYSFSPEQCQHRLG